MTDAKNLYQEVILDHNRKPRNFGALDNPTHKAEGLNPLCGDHIHITLRVRDDKVEAIAFQGEGCAICKASTSMMTTNVKGKTVEEAEMLVQEFRDMATGKLEVHKQPNHLGRLAVFEGVKDLPSRVKCAILPWHTLHAAFGSVATTTTENEQEPMKSAGVTI
ncbi:MAG TPA: SUF system NifU family Fe-S cluster assembly protein [Burkholderiales bacterium]|nr:SUF system NifU family Fe-S cluster assembly protein [Burkholderiales bacterium]